MGGFDTAGNWIKHQLAILELDLSFRYFVEL